MIKKKVGEALFKIKKTGYSAQIEQTNKITEVQWENFSRLSIRRY